MAVRALACLGTIAVLLSACSEDEATGAGGGTTTGAGAGAGGSGGQTTSDTGGQTTSGSGGEAGAGGAPCKGCDDVVNSNVGFEDGTFLNQWQLSSNNGEDCQMSVVTGNARSGTHALHVTHSIQGSGNYNRCEVVSSEQLDPGASRTGRFSWDTEYWLGYSIYLEDWATDPAGWNVLGQTHAIPFDNDWSCCSGPQFWEVTTTLDQFRVAYSIVADPYVTPVCSGGYSYWETPLGPMQNKWTDVVIHFNASVGSGGFVEVWIDGSQVIDQQGSVLYAYDSCGRPRTEELLLQMGSYKTTSSTNYRSVYYDEIRIVGATGSYQAVAPRD
jgi:hypothetical protein